MIMGYNPCHCEILGSRFVVLRKNCPVSGSVRIATSTTTEVLRRTSCGKGFGFLQQHKNLLGQGVVQGDDMIYLAPFGGLSSS